MAVRTAATQHHGEGVQRFPHLSKRHVVALEAEPTEPAQSGSLGVRSLVVADEEGDPERILEGAGRQLDRRGADDRQVAAVERSAEVDGYSSI